MSANAQDILVKHDGTTIKSKVVEVGTSEIKYKKWDNLDGPVYSISVKEVLALNYENGTQESFENKKKVVNKGKSTTSYIELQPGIGITKGYKGALGLKVGFLTELADNLKWGLGTGALESYEFNEAPAIPLYARFEYQADDYGKGALFAHLDAGYGLNVEHFDYGTIMLNPTVGAYFGNTYLGVGYLGQIATKGGGTTHSINFTLGVRMGNGSGKQTAFQRFMKKTSFAVSIGGALNGTKVSNGGDQDQSYAENKMGRGGHLDLAWTYNFNDHFALGLGAGFRYHDIVSSYYRGEGFYTEMTPAIPVFVRSEYTFLNKEKKFRPFVRADVGYMIGMDVSHGVYAQPQVGVKYKKFFTSLGLEYISDVETCWHDGDGCLEENPSMHSPVLNIGFEF